MTSGCCYYSKLNCIATQTYLEIYFKKKHGKDIFTIFKFFESPKVKYIKILLDIKFIKT